MSEVWMPTESDSIFFKEQRKESLQGAMKHMEEMYTISKTMVPFQ